MKYKQKKHNFCCRCSYCKQKRRSSLLFLASIIALVIIICYQALLLVFFITRIHAVLLFLEIAVFIFLVSLLLF